MDSNGGFLMVNKTRVIIVNGMRLPNGTKTSVKEDYSISETTTHDGNLNDEENKSPGFSIELAKNLISPAEIWNGLQNESGGYEASLQDDETLFEFTGVFCTNLSSVFDAGVRTTIPLDFKAETVTVKQI